MKKLAAAMIAVSLLFSKAWINLSEKDSTLAGDADMLEVKLGELEG